MGFLIWAGLIVSAILGTFHAAYVYRQVADSGEAGARRRAAYYTAWTIGLWLLFGTYVLALWVVSLPIYAIAKALRWRM